MRMGARALGVAVFDWHAPHEFTAGDVALTAIVTHAAAALGRLVD